MSTGRLKRLTLIITTTLTLSLSSGCAIVTVPYEIIAGTVGVTVWVLETTYDITVGTVVAVYTIGEFTFEVVTAPLDWDLMNDDIESIDGLPVKEAIRQGRVKNSPYVVKGKRYVPMSVKKSRSYKETGIASWYGEETLKQTDGHMTANGEAFNPKALSAAHKYLPLPTNVKITNLDNGQWIIARVNDRGPFPSRHNKHSGKRIIDVSEAGARRLGFYKKGTARVRVETYQVDE
jgi:rare lipoprotein A